jgi:hypothetical protein
MELGVSDDGGHLLSGDGYSVASAGAPTAHATTGGTTRRRRWGHPQQRDAHAAWGCSVSRTVHRGSIAEAAVAINHQSTKAEGGNYKATPANQEQTECRSATSAHTDLQAGRGTPHAEDGHRAADSSIFICVQGNIRRHIRRELDAKPLTALGELFPVTNNRASRRALFSDGGVGLCSQHRRRPAP